MLPRVALLSGGTSSERDVALTSAKMVEAALHRHVQLQTFVFPEAMESFLLARQEIDLAIPIFHGVGGEDGVVQGFLEMLGVPYLFSGVAAQAIALNKAWTKRLVAAEGISTPAFQVLDRSSKAVYAGPSVIKPINGGSSIAVSLVRSAEALDQALTQAFAQADEVLVESFVSGEEYTIGVIEERGKLVPLPVIQIRHARPLFDYTSKYSTEGAEELCPAPISDDLKERLQQTALTAHRVVGARHVSRTDCIVDAQGRVWFLEINLIPGMTEHSLVPKALLAAGSSLEQTLLDWIEVMLSSPRSA